MTFIFDGGKVLRCEACGWRFYAGPWDLSITGRWGGKGAISSHGRYAKRADDHRRCIPCGGEMVETHVGRADGWVEIEAVGA